MRTSLPFTLFSSGLDPIVTTWVKAVVSNGGTVSGTIQSAANNLVKSLKSNSGLWSVMNNGSSRFSLLAGDQLAAAVVPLIAGGGSALDTAHNLTGAYGSSSGITGNSNNRRLDTGVTPTQAGQTVANGSSLVWSSGGMPGGQPEMIFTDGGGHEEFYYNQVNPPWVSTYCGQTPAFSDQTPSINGNTMFGMIVNSNAINQVIRGETRSNATGTSSGALSSNVYSLLGRASGQNFGTSQTLCGYFFGGALTAAQIFALDNAMATFCSAIGRNVSPTLIPIRCFGDSITNGFDSSSPWYQQLYASNTLRMVGNFGVNGQTSSQIATRLLSDANLSRDIYIIMAGTNDYQNVGGVAATESAIASMVSAITATGNNKYLILTPLGYNTDTIGTTNYNYLVSICNWIATTYPLNYVDTRQAIINAYNPGSPSDVTAYNNQVSPPSLLADGSLHPNAAGDTVISNDIVTFLTSMGW